VAVLAVPHHPVSHRQGREALDRHRAGVPGAQILAEGGPGVGILGAGGVRSPRGVAPGCLGGSGGRRDYRLPGGPDLGPLPAEPLLPPL